jgi:hypothetical protein
MKTVVARWMLGMGLFVTPVVLACSTDAGSEGAEEAATGNVNLALLGQAPSGVQYRLRNATFNVTGPTSVSLDSEVDPNATALSATLSVGSYSAQLAGQWALERLDAMGPVVVEATLVSPNPATFDVIAGSVTNLVFQFATNGTIVTIGTGDLQISIGVTETSGGGGGSCTLLDPATCPPGTWCGPISIDQVACQSGGMTPVGSACSATSLCVSGAVCVDIGAGPTCIKVCDFTDPTTCSPLGCQNVGAMLFGLCL